jgi:hypothetical protein
MAQEQPRTDALSRAVIRRGADDQLAALERLWAAAVRRDSGADGRDWQVLRHALNVSRRDEGARILFEDEEDE